MQFSTLTKQPSAFLPVARSLAALATVLGHVAMFGAAREADEGTRTPREALQILALQAGAVLAALAPVFFLNL